MPQSTTTLEPLARKLATHSELSAAERDAVLSLSHHRRPVSAHAQLFRHGEPARHCSVLLDGYAFRYKLLSDGSRQVLNVLVRGDLVGVERALFGRSDHSVEVLTAGVVGEILVADVEKLVAAHPGLSRALWSETLFEGAIQREWIVNVGRRDAKGRLAHLLCELGVRHELMGLGERTAYDLPLTQTHIADCAGLTPVHVNRVLQSLRGSGLIKSGDRRVTIEDWDGLARTGGFDERYLCVEPVVIASRQTTSNSPPVGDVAWRNEVGRPVSARSPR